MKILAMFIELLVGHGLVVWVIGEGSSTGNRKKAT